MKKSHQNPSKNLSSILDVHLFSSIFISFDGLLGPWHIAKASGAFRLAHADETVLCQVIDGWMAADERRG